MDWEKLLRGAREQGWRVERRSRHIWLWAPSGGTVSIPTSSSDWRAIHNCVAQMRRLGFVWRGRRAAGEPPPASDAPSEDDVLRQVGWALSADELVYSTVVEERRPLSPTELAALTGLARSAVLAVVAALTEEGFLERVGYRRREKRGVRPEGIYALPGRG